MIYGIIGLNTEVPLSKFHIYLKEKTGNDGGDLPEAFHNICGMENINSLYAFSVACVITNTFTKIPRHSYGTRDLAILGLAQTLKTLATTIPLKKKCITPLYDHFKQTGLVGTAPSVLNLDGDLFSFYHYDKETYISREEADMAEDSFPYWVINVAKAIKEAEDLVQPKKDVIYMVPYYIQNISQEQVEIYDAPVKTKEHVIGYIPPTGLEVVKSVRNGYGKLMTAKNAYVELNGKKIIPVKHYEDDENDIYELADFESLFDIGHDDIKFPFKITLNDNCSIKCGNGFGSHYKPEIEYKENKVLEIDELFFHNKYGIIHSDYGDLYIPLDVKLVSFYEPSSKEVKEEQKQDVEEAEDNPIYHIMNKYRKLQYLNIAVYLESRDAYIAQNNIIKGIEKTLKRGGTPLVNPFDLVIFKDERDTVDKYVLLISGSETEEEAKKIRKYVASYGCKAVTQLYRDVF